MNRNQQLVIVPGEATLSISTRSTEKRSDDKAKRQNKILREQRDSLAKGKRIRFTPNQRRRLAKRARSLSDNLRYHVSAAVKV